MKSPPVCRVARELCQCVVSVRERRERETERVALSRFSTCFARAFHRRATLLFFDTRVLSSLPLPVRERERERERVACRERVSPRESERERESGVPRESVTAQERGNWGGRFHRRFRCVGSEEGSSRAASAAQSTILDTGVSAKKGAC